MYGSEKVKRVGYSARILFIHVKGGGGGQTRKVNELLSFSYAAGIVSREV